MAAAEFIFGIHTVKTKLQRNIEQVQSIWLQQGRDDQRLRSLQKLAEDAGIPVQVVPRKELDNRVNGRHQGVVAACSPTLVRNEIDLQNLINGLDEPAFLLILDGITDPHNLGACIRTADAAGVHAIIAPKDKSTTITSTVLKVACGAAENVPFIQVTNLVRCLKSLQQQGIWITGTAGEAQQTLFEADLTGPMALIMGAEGDGMRRLSKEYCDYIISIPMAGEVSSLNVSVAAGVCLFEMVRQRHLVKSQLAN